MLGDFSTKIGKKLIFKPTIGSGIIHEISIDNGIRVINFAVSKYLTVKNTLFSHRNIYKFTWTRCGKPYNQIDHTLWWIGDGIQVRFLYDRSRDQTVILTIIWGFRKLRREWQWINKQTQLSYGNVQYEEFKGVRKKRTLSD